MSAPHAPASHTAPAREAFPLLRAQPQLAYLDNAATAQKPDAVLEALQRFYTQDNANIHRGVHALSQRATQLYEESRATVAAFLGAAGPEGIVFVRNATEGINLVAHSHGRAHIRPGQCVLLTGMEHHANIVPWQLFAEASGAQLQVVPVTPGGELDREAYAQLLRTHDVALVGLVHVSNALGTINPARELIAEAHEAGALVLLDAAQSAPHMPVNVTELDCDFLVASGHKLFGPTGIGVLYGKPALLEAMPPFLGGGDMITRVTWGGTRFKPPPERFEAGTPDIAGVAGLAAAVTFLQGQDRKALLAHEEALRQRAEEGLASIPGLRIIGTAPAKASVVSFVHESVHPHDIGTFLDTDGIAIRAGHHCCQPLMRDMGLPGTARASFAFYNTLDEVDRLVASVRRVVDFFAG